MITLKFRGNGGILQNKFRGNGGFRCFKFSEKRMPLGAAHRTKQRDLRLYMLVGGMPQAVNEYLNTNNLAKVDAVKRRIIKLYSDDFLKIDSTGKLSKLFMAIPTQLRICFGMIKLSVFTC